MRFNVILQVVAQEVVRPLLAQWRSSLPGTEAEQRELTRQLWAAFVQSFEAERGPPPGSMIDPSTDPTTTWCPFPGGLAQVVVQPDRWVGWFTVVRRVVVVDLNFSPGLPQPVG